MVKIAYVHEGKKQVGKDRYELINPRYFTDLQGNSEDFWLEVSTYIEEAYNTDKIGKIYLSGDGAKCIISNTEEPTKKEAVIKAKRYILNHWDGVLKVQMKWQD